MTDNTQFVYTAEDESFNYRKRMVDTQIAPRDVRDVRVLDAMLEVPRHRFCERATLSEIYGDWPVSIGCGQTISQPYIVAKIADLLALEGHESVLEIGAGCGYQAAVLSRLVRRVVAVEYHGDLAARAGSTLGRLGYDNVEVRHGDGKLPQGRDGEFDRIVVSCSIPGMVPAWERELAVGGMIVFPMNDPEGGEVQSLCRWRKLPEGRWDRERIFGVRFVPLL